jgi:hypothetical protein
VNSLLSIHKSVAEGIPIPPLSFSCGSSHPPPSLTSPRLRRVPQLHPRTHTVIPHRIPVPCTHPPSTHGTRPPVRTANAEPLVAGRVVTGWGVVGGAELFVWREDRVQSLTSSFLVRRGLRWVGGTGYGVVLVGDTVLNIARSFW